MRASDLFILSALASLALAAQVRAAAADPAGEWRIADGTANVQIRRCAAALCGQVSWAKDAAMIGRQVLVSMKPDGDVWAGLVVDARNGAKYNGRISLRGEQTLRVEGCVLGGIICGGQNWSRVK